MVRIESLIRSVRGLRVMLDSDLARIYGVELKRLNEQVQRNVERFPGDFAFQLTPEEFAAKFGPTEQDYAAVIVFAQANGLAVRGTHPNRTLLDVSGSVADIENAFHVTMHVYQHPAEARTFYAPDGEPSLDLAAPVLGISGLNNYALPRPRVHATRLESRAGVSPAPGSNAGRGRGAGETPFRFRAGQHLHGRRFPGSLCS